MQPETGHAAGEGQHSQVALRSLTRNKSVFAIPKAASPGHSVENAGVTDFSLTKNEIEMIYEAFPLGSSTSSFRTF